MSRGETAELLLTQAVYARAFASSTDTMVVADVQGRIVQANPAWLKLYGYALDEVVGQKMSLIKGSASSAEMYRYMFRQNAQGEGVFNAPDLAASLALSLDQCPQGKMVLQARVTNLGSLGVGAGVAVDFYQGTPEDSVLLGTVSTPQALLPGASVVLSFEVPALHVPTDFYVVVDPQGSGVLAVPECDESNNEASLIAVMCYIT